MKKTVQIVTIPLDKEGWSKDELLKHIIKDTTQYSQVGDYKLINGGNSLNAKCWQPQQLLVLSDDEIQEGDSVYDLVNNRVELIIGVNKESEVCKFKGGAFDLKYTKKLIASYPQLEGTLPIPKETIQAWIDSSTPGEGVIEMEETEYSKLKQYPVSIEYQEVIDVKGNLLLEFPKQQPEEDIHNAVAGYREKHTQKAEDALFPYTQCGDLTKPTILTDEEIEKKANSRYKIDEDQSIKSERNGSVIRCREGYIEGYKQALKDMGYE